MKRDYYEVLSVPRNATSEEIKKSYRKLAMQYHPDRNHGNVQAEVMFKEAAEAYAVLSDPEKRAQYDQFGHSMGGRGFQGFEGFEDAFRGFGDIFGDIFEDLFTGGSGRSRGERGRRGSDLEISVEITLEDVLKGREADLEVSRRETCSECTGSGSASGSKKKKCNACGGYGEVRITQGFFTMRRTCSTCQGEGEIIESPCPKCKSHGRVPKNRKLSIKIPPGVDTHSRLKLVGEGEAGEKGGMRGDLYVLLVVKPHPVFQRRESDLYCEVTSPFTILALGGETQVPSLEKPLSLKIPSGTVSGKIFKIEGSGLPHLRNTTARGDLYIKVDVAVPKKLNDEEKKLLEQFAALRGEKTHPQKKGILDRLKNNL